MISVVCLREGRLLTLSLAWRLHERESKWLMVDEGGKIAGEAIEVKELFLIPVFWDTNCVALSVCESGGE